MSKIIILSDDDNLLLKLFEKLDSDFVNNVTHILALKIIRVNLTKYLKNPKLCREMSIPKANKQKF